MDKIQKICVSAEIFKDGKILLLQRSKSEDPFPEYWELPGGKLEFGESTAAGLKREVMEEAGIEVEVIRSIADFTYIYNDKHYLDIQYLCHPLSNEIKLSPEHDNHMWAAEEDLDDLIMSPEMKSAVKKGFGILNK